MDDEANSLSCRLFGCLLLGFCERKTPDHNNGLHTKPFEKRTFVEKQNTSMFL